MCATCLRVELPYCVRARSLASYLYPIPHSETLWLYFGCGQLANTVTISPFVACSRTLGVDTFRCSPCRWWVCSWFSPVWLQVVNAFDNDPFLENIHFPSTPEPFASQSEYFSRGGHNPLRGCVFALDGIALRIRRPRVAEVPIPSSYLTRKGFFAINVQAAVCGDYNVQFLSTLTPGSRHDSTVFSACELAELLYGEDGLPQGYLVAGDDAYVVSLRCLAPWPGKDLPREKDSFNYYHSSSRTFVEQVFGQIVARWGILWRSIRYSVCRASLIMRVCVRLQNVLCERRSPPPPALLLEDGSGGTGEVIVQDQCDLDDRLRVRRRDREPCPLRAALNCRLKRLQYRRPA